MNKKPAVFSQLYSHVLVLGTIKTAINQIQHFQFFTNNFQSKVTLHIKKYKLGGRSLNKINLNQFTQLQNLFLYAFNKKKMLITIL